MTITKLVGICSSALVFGCTTSEPDSPVEVARHDAITVHGTGTLFGHTSSGIVSQPMDLSAATFATFARSHGELVREVGEGTADGTFTVPVAAGARTWDLEAVVAGAMRIAVGDARHPDVSQHVLGRLDGTFPTAETEVAVDATGLSPWADLDTLQILVPNSGAYAPFIEFFLSTPPAVGDTALAGQTIDWSQQILPEPLVDAAKGDVAMLSQLVGRTSGSETYQGLERSGAASSFTQTDGSASTLSVAMASVPQRSLALHWRGSDFDALAAAVGSGATTPSEGQGVAIDALPDAARFGFYTSSPDLMLYTASAGASDLEATVSYGNPYATLGTPWDEYAIVFYSWQVPVGSVFEFPGYQANLPIDRLSHGVVKPLISPVREVTIAGRDLRSPQLGVGASPMVHWASPAIGHATEYFVELKTTTATSTKLVARFITKEREVQIPSEFLATGTTYFLKITAVDFGDVDNTVSLFGDGLPVTLIDKVTATFTP